ncbi:MAG TPA: hypothetical protein VLS46_04250, partial [Gaiellaceae bacterium]|nr:hypothetical protein [Gaiellaceae bacterium]
MLLHQNSEILAALGVDVRGDHGNADVNEGTNMTLRGQLIAGCVLTPGDPVGDCAPSAANPVHLFQIWGHTDVDTIHFGDATGIAGGTTHGDAGYVFIGSKTIARGGQDDGSSLGDDGEDRFVVWYLQDADVTERTPAGGTIAGAGHTLTLDGQADSDTYTVYTTGSRGDARHYVINVLDTGAEDDGVDEALVYGFDSTLDGIDPGSPVGEKHANDDLFLLRATKCIDTESPYGVSSTVPSACTSPVEDAIRPAFVALLHGDLAAYRDTIQGNEPTTEVQRINYDQALNGRLSVFGLGGNDQFFVDDNSAITTLDGGSGYDSFQIGQIFGLKRDGLEGAVLPHDTFPTLVATTRGWLSPGTHAPLVAQGGTGNDEFTVYSNQAEIRLEGDDGNDIFTVRAFALAAVCDTDATGDGECTFADIDIEADPVTALYPADSTGDGICDAADADSYTGFRLDNNGDGVCNKADAHMTNDDENTLWEDDTIPVDADGVARPRIGLGFSTARPLDIRAGGGEDEVSYNVNAPVSLDGGTGIDKMVLLGTEFADDIVITAGGIFGGGLNVRYANIELVEVDGLEGDDEFFVQSTAFGVAYRVIGGLGSDTINVTGDVTEDIVVRELEGISGAVDHLVSADDDPLYDGLPADGIDYNVATPGLGNVVITETGSGTSVREGGSTSVPSIDAYKIRLAVAPTATVYITVSAPRSAQEEADGSLINPSPLPNGLGDTIWLCTGPSDASCDDGNAEFQRHIVVNGDPTDVPQRALVLVFTAANWNVDQYVYVFAVDDPRSEGDRVVVAQHSVISEDDRFDGTRVRNVEVSVRDNDTPGVFVTEVEPDTNVEDRRTLVIEGGTFGVDYTGRDDDLLIELAKAPQVGDVIVVRIELDAESQQAIQLFDKGSAGRFQQHIADSSTHYTITFTHLDWDAPVRVGVKARYDSRREDPQTAVLRFSRDASTTDSDGDYVFPNL